MNQDALTAVEVAEILKVAKNTVYELVKRGELNCYKVGRKMRFTYADVQTYINSKKQTAAGPAAVSEPETDPEPAARREAVPVTVPAAGGMGESFCLCGQDEILDRLQWYLDRSLPEFKSERVRKGSYESLAMLYKDQVSAAASHMWDAEDDVYNVPFVKRMLPGCDAVIVHICDRTQGFYVAEGNPKNIREWKDLARPDIRLANREPGAGTRILLDEHLRMLGISGENIAGYNEHLPSHLAVAGRISKGQADVGIGAMKTALGIRGISFIPQQQESYDLVFKKRDLDKPAIRQIIRILQGEELKEEFRFVSGYDVERMGEFILL